MGGEINDHLREALHQSILTIIRNNINAVRILKIHCKLKRIENNCLFSFYSLTELLSESVSNLCRISNSVVDDFISYVMDFSNVKGCVSPFIVCFLAAADCSDSLQQKSALNRFI